MASQEMHQGEDTEVTITLQTTTIDLTPTELKFRLEKDGKTLVQHTIADGNVAVLSTTSFKVTLDKADTINADVGTYFWQALHIDDSNLETVIEVEPTTVTIKKRAGFT